MSQKYNKIILIAIVLLISTQCAIRKDIVPRVPGYPDTYQTQVYSGYLNTSSQARRLHYVFIESINGVNNTDPVTLWLNGGPGCSSMIGFLQQIGPFYLEQGLNYTVGDKLTPNKYSWNNHSNLLFIQSPPGVGYSINKDLQYKYNDANTANDNFMALLNFFQNYPEYSKNPFWIAGQSYAGKYIPDLTLLIDAYNEKLNSTQIKINLKGLLIGNGVMNMADLQKSQIDYMIDHQFVDPELIQYYNRACTFDELSAGCQYFKNKYYQNIEQLNIFDYLMHFKQMFTIIVIIMILLCHIANNKNKFKQVKKISLKDFHPKQVFLDNSLDLANIHHKNQINFRFQNQNIMDHNVCISMVYINILMLILNNFTAKMLILGMDLAFSLHFIQSDKINQAYMIDITGSINQYKKLLSNVSKYHIIHYNGDWDDVVPYTDTIKNYQKLKLVEDHLYTPFFVNDQHAGFIQLYSGITFMLIKGGSHMVPQSKRAEAFELFELAMKNGGSQEKFKQTMLKR